MNQHPNHADPKPVIGLLYPGEMGHRLAELLIQQGYVVISPLADRSPRTTTQAAQVGVRPIATLAAFGSAAEIVISIVPPKAAAEVADVYLSCPVRPEHAVYVDTNAISPSTVQRIYEACQRKRVGFVDASIHGLASRLTTNGRIYFSGPHRLAAAPLFEDVLPVSDLGPEVGAASAMKMLIGGLNKGITALFLELAAVAHSLGLLESILPVYEQSYPGVMEVVARLLPTYPRHASRRVEELEELVVTAECGGVTANMLPAAASTTAWLRDCGEATAFDAWGESLIELARRLVQTTSQAADPSTSQDTLAS